MNRLKFTRLKEFRYIFKRDYKQLCHLWTICPITLEVLDRINISKKQFENMIAPILFNNFLKVIDGNVALGITKHLDALLTIFHELNIKVYDLFIIYTQFKNIICEYAVSAGDNILYRESTFILDKNLSLLIAKYTDFEYEIVENIDVIQVSKQSISDTSTEKIKKEEENNISAKEFAEIEPIDEELMQDLTDVEFEFEPLFYSHNTISKPLIIEVNKLLYIYGSILNRTLEFGELHTNIEHFSQILSNLDIDNLGEDQKSSFYIMIKAVLTDLITWKNEVFIYKTTHDIHFLDKSIISGIIQCEALMTGDQVDNDEVIFF